MNDLLLKKTNIDWLDKVIDQANEIAAILVIESLHSARKSTQKVEDEDDSIREEIRQS